MYYYDLLNDTLRCFAVWKISSLASTACQKKQLQIANQVKIILTAEIVVKIWKVLSSFLRSKTENLVAINFEK